MVIERSCTGSNWGTGEFRSFVDVLVLDVDGMVVLTSFINVSVDVDIGTIGPSNGSIIIIARWSTKSSSTCVRLESSDSTLVEASVRERAILRISC